MITKCESGNLEPGLYVMFCRQSCMIIPDLSKKTLSVDGKCNVLHDINGGLTRESLLKS